MNNDQYNRLRDRAEARHKRPVYLALQYQINPVVEAYKSGGYSAAIKAANQDTVNEKMVPAIRNLYIDGGLTMARAQYKELRKIELKAVSEWRGQLTNFFNRFILTKVVLPITKTTKDLILQQLKISIEQGLGERETIALLRMTDISKRRTQVIVRTEMGAAFGFGQEVAANEFPYESKKRWNAVLDLRTRYTHKHGTGVDGEVREWNERFSNGLMRPGDKAGPAREVCNCRCRLDVIPKRDKNGRLIPKKQLPNPVANPTTTGARAGAQGLRDFAQSLLLEQSIQTIINTENETL